MHYPYVTQNFPWARPFARSFTGWTMNLLNSLSAASCCNVGTDFTSTGLKSHFWNSAKSSPRLHHQAPEKVRPAVNIYLLIRDSGVELVSLFPLCSLNHCECQQDIISPSQAQQRQGLVNWEIHVQKMHARLLNGIKKRLFHLMVLHVI